MKMRSIEHINLRKILGIKMDKYLELVYEYYDYNLYSYVRNTEFGFDDRKKVALDIIDGLIFLHSK